jgi:hypothetical protein
VSIQCKRSYQLRLCGAALLFGGRVAIAGPDFFGSSCARYAPAPYSLAGKPHNERLRREPAGGSYRAAGTRICGTSFWRTISSSSAATKRMTHLATHALEPESLLNMHGSLADACHHLRGCILFDRPQHIITDMRDRYAKSSLGFRGGTSALHPSTSALASDKPASDFTNARFFRDDSADGS